MDKIIASMALSCIVGNGVFANFCSGNSSPPLSNEILVNGDFEFFSAGVPVAWDYIQGDGAASLASSNQTSPFQHSYPAGSHSVLLTDGSSEYFPSLRQSFPPRIDTLAFALDFRIDDPPNNYGGLWHIYPRATSGSVPMNVIFDSIDGEHRLTIPGVPSSFQVNVDAEQWYSLTVILNQATRSTSGTLTRFGGQTLSWSDLKYSNGSASNVASVTIGDSWIPMNSAIYFDNFSLRPVPEPTATCLSALGFGLAVAFRKRKGREFNYASAGTSRG